MSVSRVVADALVRAYLNGRALPEAAHDAVVALARTRLLNGCMPVLDDPFRRDIDRQATAAQGLGGTDPAEASERPVMCFVPNGSLRA